MGEEETDHWDLETFFLDRNFVVEQRSDPTLSHAYVQLDSIDEKVTVSRRLSVPTLCTQEGAVVSYQEESSNGGDVGPAASSVLLLLSGVDIPSGTSGERKDVGY